MDVDPPKADKLAASNVAQRSPRSEDDLMDAENPYASPRYTEPTVPTAAQSTSTPAQFPNLWRTGNKLIVQSETLLPDVCPKCGKPAEGQQRVYQAAWDSPWRNAACMAPALVLYIAPGLPWWIKVVGGFVSVVACSWVARRYCKQGSIYYRYCQRHERRRVNMPWYATLASIATIGIALAVFAYARFASTAGDPVHLPFMLLVLIGVIGGLLILLFAARTALQLPVHRIRGPYIWISGVHRRLLNLVPEATPAELAKLMKEPN